MSGWLNNVVARLVVYYAALLAVFNVVLLAFPWIADAIARERARGVTGSLLVTAGDARAPLPAAVPLTDLQVLVRIALTLLGALALALPVRRLIAPDLRL